MKNIEEYFKNFYKGTKKATLDAMKYFMDEYNDFQKDMKIIHIAGTNGKGSCTEIISNILVKEGYKVGKFLSPHLIKYSERISINGDNISDEEMLDLIEELEPKINKYYEETNIKITYFEIITIMALLYFYRNNVDFVVLETGLGGIYDCTNIISNPLVSVITSIGYDHVHILGNTLEEIAHQKAGIIKEKSNTVIFNQNSEINEVFIKKCNEKHNELHIVTENQITNYSYDEEYQYFNYDDFKNLAINLKGKIQVKNASICIETIKIINKLGHKVTEKSIREGLKTVIHKGRMETLSRNPLIVYDGAHNEPAIRNLQEMVGMYYKNLERVYVISILKRKDYHKMLELLLQDKDAIFILTSGNDLQKFASSQDLYSIAIKYNDGAKIYQKTLEEAIEYAMRSGRETVNLFVGSFYTYGTVSEKIV